jgi:sigma-B regulation protein RsbU (phosphoserine phosphatase)
MGIIYMDCQIMGNLFTKEDLSLLMAVAGQAALSYENARSVASYIEKQKQDNELSIARTVQHALLPNNFPEVDGYQFYACYDSARAIGGDYYDCFMMGDEKVVVTVGDVAGKGVPSALLMTWLSSCVQSTLRFFTDVERAFRTINEYTCNNTVEGRFVTFVLILIDLKTHELSLMNAGHLSPLIRRKNGHVETFSDETVGPPMGIIEDHPYEVDKRTLNSGDMCVIITDVVYEALNEAGERYGTERVISLMRGGERSAKELAKALLADVRRHAQGQSQNDDITIVAISRDPNQ